MLKQIIMEARGRPQVEDFEGLANKKFALEFERHPEFREIQKLADTGIRTPLTVEIPPRLADTIFGKLSEVSGSSTREYANLNLDAFRQTDSMERLVYWYISTDLSGVDKATWNAKVGFGARVLWLLYKFTSKWKRFNPKAKKVANPVDKAMRRTLTKRSAAF